MSEQLAAPLAGGAGPCLGPNLAVPVEELRSPSAVPPLTAALTAHPVPPCPDGTCVPPGAGARAAVAMRVELNGQQVTHEGNKPNSEADHRRRGESEQASAYEPQDSVLAGDHGT
jgi:hypothetical protein